MTIAYYNEHDADKAAWLRELIKAGLIAAGEVDERDIQDVLPRELVGYTQCHFFAGIGIWSYALRQAGWPDDRPVWTGSCPCQPFSAAGKRGGTADERHLWPAFFHLISINRPDVVFGEQVASKDGFAWLDTVQTDLEAAAYAVGAVAVPACGFGAPHKRERLFFVADTLRAGRTERRSEPGFGPPTGRGEPGSLADPQINGTSDNSQAWQSDLQRGRAIDDLGDAASERCREAGAGCGRSAERTGNTGESGDLGHAEISGGRPLNGQSRTSAQFREPVGGSGISCDLAGVALGDTGGERLEIGPLPDGRLGVVRVKGSTVAETGAVNGFWKDADAILCNDEDAWKWRAVERGSFPLAHGAAARVLRLRGYGDGIAAPVAEEFIRAYIQVRG